MNLFKVAFDHNMPVSAEKLYIPQCGTVKMETVNGRKELRSLTIYADTERESIEIAEKVVRDFYLFLHMK